MDLITNYRELKSKINNTQDSQKIARFKSIVKDIRALDLEIRELIISMDREEYSLTPQEQKRVEQDEIQDRVIERALPFMILSDLIENLQ